MKTITLAQANQDLVSHINYSLRTHEAVNIASENGAMMIYILRRVYSRRVNHKDRLIYTIYESDKIVDITSVRGHYE